MLASSSLTNFQFQMGFEFVITRPMYYVIDFIKNSWVCRKSEYKHQRIRRNTGGYWQYFEQDLFHRDSSVSVSCFAEGYIDGNFFIVFFFFLGKHLIFQIETISKEFGTALHQSQCKKFVKLFGKEKNFGFVYLFVHISFREEKQNWK